MSESNTTLPGILRLGTSSWSHKGWVGPFYEPGVQARDYIAAYARKLDTVEIDATFYGIPRESTIEGWRDRTPEGFLFAAKAPQAITHEKSMKNCEGDLEAFLSAMSILGPKLGPILFQFPYYAKRRGITQQDFVERLNAFLPRLPRDGFQFAVEVRNKAWLKPPLTDILREHGVTLCLIDHPWMAPPSQLFASDELRTGPFQYIR